jgi:conjugal transfer pilus assembly protein TraV
MMTKKIVSALFLVSAGFAMSGCSLLGQNDEYGCKGMPNSVTCMNVRDVYALTDGDDYQEQIDTASENQLSGKPVEVKRLHYSRERWTEYCRWWSIRPCACYCC